MMEVPEDPALFHTGPEKVDILYLVVLAKDLEAGARARCTDPYWLGFYKAFMVVQARDSVGSSTYRVFGVPLTAITMLRRQNVYILKPENTPDLLDRMVTVIDQCYQHSRKEVLERMADRLSPRPQLVPRVQ